MKITGLKTFLLKEWRTMLMVVVETDEGITGLGESGLTSREFAVQGMIRDLESLVIGQDPFRTEYLWQLLWRSGFHPSGQVLSSAIAAIDLALWDIKGKACGVPVFDLMGGRTRDKVLSYCHIHGATPEETLNDARTRVAEGWKVLRFEPSYKSDMVMRSGWALAKAVEEFRLLREDLGPDIGLAFDAHTKLTPPEAAWFCREVEACTPYFVEDPLRSEYPDGYRNLRRQTSIPLAAGEQFANKWQFGPLLRDRLIDYVRVDLCIAGGLTEAWKIAALSEAHGVDLAVHNPIGPVSTAACLHLNLACPNVLVQELPKRPGECLPDLIETDQTWSDGWLSSLGKPGLGVEIDLGFLDRYPFEHEHLPILHREDGAITNW